MSGASSVPRQLKDYKTLHESGFLFALDRIINYRDDEETREQWEHGFGDLAIQLGQSSGHRDTQAVSPAQFNAPYTLAVTCMTATRKDSCSARPGPSA